MNDLALVSFAGLGLGSLYFLLASGLSLIFGLMRVLSFAHGSLLTVGAFGAWQVMSRLETASTAGLLLAVLVAMVVSGGVALVIELLVIRPLAGRTMEQLLATVGIGSAVVALVAGIWGPDEHLVHLPDWLRATTQVLGAPVPNARLVLVAAAAVVLLLIKGMLRWSRVGLVVRAGVENPEMVSALGIDVRRAFTFVFTVGGVLAGLGGALAAIYYRGVTPYVGDHMLVFAFIVLVIGGLGSIDGALIAAVVLGLSQSLINYLWHPGSGDIAVILMLIVMLAVRPQGLFGRKERVA